MMRHACPASWPGKTIWTEVYYGFEAAEEEIMIEMTPIL